MEIPEEIEGLASSVHGAGATPTTRAEKDEPVKRVFEREHEGYSYYYDLGSILRIMLFPFTEEEDEVNEGSITYMNGNTERLTREKAIELKDAWIAYLEGSAQQLKVRTFAFRTRRGAVSPEREVGSRIARLPTSRLSSTRAAFQ